MLDCPLHTHTSPNTTSLIVAAGVLAAQPAQLARMVTLTPSAAAVGFSAALQRM